MKFDYILVGGGLAGSILAETFLRKGKKVCLIQDDSMSHCSYISAGLFNPIVFKRMTLSWMAEEGISAMLEFFRICEASSKIGFVRNLDCYKLLTEEEALVWQKKSKNELESFVDPDHVAAAERLMFLKGRLGKINRGGVVDVVGFLRLVKEKLKKQGGWKEERFDFDKIEISENGIRYKEVSAKQIIFCEGYLVGENPYFSHCGWKPVKGEMILVDCPELRMDFLLFKDFFILPQQNAAHHFLVGATYHWDALNEELTKEGRDFLVQKFSSLVPYPFEVIRQIAGVRPATIDRRPVIGLHPKHKCLGVFNGFGTKTLLLAPYFAEQLYQHLENNMELAAAVKVSRFSKTL